MEMTSTVRSRLLLSLGVIGFSLVIVFQYWGIPLVPFHPDESTQLYMAADFKQLFRSPLSLAWSAEKAADKKQNYRLLDAPLTRYLVGFGLWINHRPTLPADWDWSKSWEENSDAGALPNPEILRQARMITTAMLPLAMGFLFLTGLSIGGTLTGFIAAIFLGLNALLLLHGRRAMAESALLMSVSLCMWGMIKGDKHPWLAGIGAALAFSSKQSAIAFLPAGLISVVWLTENTGRNSRQRWGNLLVFSLVFLLICMLLNPIFWKQPLSAMQASWQARADLVDRQVNESLAAGNDGSNSKVNTRSAVLLANLFIIPLSFAEVGNYLEYTDPSMRSYLAIPAHNLARGFIGGGFLFALTLAGIILGFRFYRRADAAWRRKFILLLIAMVMQIIVLVIWLPLPWQRYIIPLVPFACLWPAFSFQQLLKIKDTKK